MLDWVFLGELARSARPRIKGRHGSVPKSVVDAWIKDAKAQNIRSVICLLEHRELDKYYEELPTDLISYYRSKGLQVVHINVPNRRPNVSEHHLNMAWKAFQYVQKPTALHCSAGIGRTGAIVRYLRKRLK
jgi:protein tyrosine phosphatase